MSDCSLTAYEEIIKLALSEGWTFRSYNDSDSGLAPRMLILRHDVDFSLDKAVELARVNERLGVRGTFFLLLRSNLYNLLAPRNLSRARELIDLRQNIGLHFAALDPIPDAAEVVRQVKTEMELLKSELPQTEPVVAWHNPTAAWLEQCADLEIPGLINVYSQRFTKGLCYRSDSNLKHNVSVFENLLRDPSPVGLHLLFHPVIWSVGGRDMIEILGGCLQQVVREREDDFRLNRVYQAAMPDGMPQSVLDDFIRHWEKAARNSD